jgi:proteasome lid subunit RPN8/RPN11
MTSGSSSSQEPPTTPLNPDKVSSNSAAQQKTHRFFSATPPYISLPSAASAASISPHAKPPPSFSQGFGWYDRSILRDATLFGPDSDGFVLIVTPQATKEIQEGTRRNKPNEAFGLLMGRTYADDEGIFTIVSGAVYAYRLHATPENFRLPSREMRELRLVASRIHPTADFVGWTHSHTMYSPYSSIDRIEQARWTQSYNVGILTFMEAKPEEPWAIAYRGPSSRPLLPQETIAWFEGMEQQSSIDDEQEQESFEQNEDIADRQIIEELHRGSRLNTGLFVLFLFLFLAATFILGNTLYNIETTVTSLNSQITLLKAKTFSSSSTAVTATNFLWNCNTQSGTAPLKVKCNGPVGPAIKQWTWDFGDSTIQKASSVAHIYPHPGTYIITLTIMTSSGEQQAGSLNILVTNPPGTPSGS